MSRSIYIGLDPSFTCYGVSVIDGDNKLIYFNSFKNSPGSKKIKFLSWASYNLVTEIEEWLNKMYLLKADTYIGQEAPVPHAPGSSTQMLYILGAFTYVRLGGYSSYERINTYNVYSIRRIHNNSKYTKKDTIKVVEAILEHFKAHSYTTYINTKTFNDGEADAFIYALKEFLLDSKDDELIDEILEVYPEFLKIEREAD